MKTYLLVCIVWMLSVCPKPVLANKLGFRKENGTLKNVLRTLDAVKFA